MFSILYQRGSHESCYSLHLLIVTTLRPTCRVRVVDESITVDHSRINWGLEYKDRVRGQDTQLIQVILVIKSCGIGWHPMP